ncbi:S8 family serine peptidase [Lentilactobacillus diolivorans]|nr:S8 family serine peptidase [Lentilactobacillus diolivorans]GEP24457.1 hypothetical protein LDI01_20500 [Lentilactobacillus diolivorans]
MRLLGKLFKKKINRIILMGASVVIPLCAGLSLGFSNILFSNLAPTVVYAKGNMNQEAINKGNITPLWREEYRGKGMVVAIIDTGIQPHKDLRLSDPNTAAISKSDAQRLIAQKGYGRYINSKIPFAYDYATNSNQATEPDNISSFHGQHCAGIVAANGRVTKKSSKYVVGVAPEAQLLDLRVSDMIDDESHNDVARAIHDAVDLGANVISISLGSGFPNQSPFDEEQAAVQYAVDHGVFVSIAGGNNGHGASIYTKNPTATTGDITTGYAAANSGIIADPGIAANAMTAGAENNSKGSDTDMTGYSSWGPTPTYVLKPDISAPGIASTSTWRDNGYATQGGTSAATPYISGAAALIIEKLKQTQPNLIGSQLVMETKNMLMNSATPMKDVQYKSGYISPRRQGSGGINVLAAGNLQVTAVDPTTNIGSVSLGQVDNHKSFTVQIANHGSQPITYTFDNAIGPLTETRDTKKEGQVHDVSLSGATLTADQSTFTVDPQQTKSINLTLNLNNQSQKNPVIEGYLRFVADDKSQSLSVPYLGYEGDLTKEQVIDSPAFQSNSAFRGGYLMDEFNTPLGISDRDSLSAYVNNQANKTSWAKIASKIHPARVAFSPNGDHRQDAVKPFVFAKQGLANVTAQIVDDQGTVIRIIDQETNTDRSIGDNTNNLDLSTSYSMRRDPNAFEWDGTYTNTKTGRTQVAPNGQYHYQLITTNYNDGAAKVQTTTYPVRVDDQAPTVKAVKYSVKKGTLSGKFSDHGAGFVPISRGVLKVAGSQYGVSLTKKTTHQGAFTKRLSQAVKNKLNKHSATFMLTDIAGNRTIVKVVKASAAKAKSHKQTQAKNRVPQLKWYLYGTSDYSFIDMKNRAFTVLARIPKNVPGMTAFAEDTQSGQVVKGRLNRAKGIAAFKLKFDKAGYIVLQGWAQVPGKQFGAFLRSPKKMISFGQYPNSDNFNQLKKRAPKLNSNTKAVKQLRLSYGAPTPHGHKRSQLTYQQTPSKGIKFARLNDNFQTYLNAKNSAKIYNEKTHELTISGKVSHPSQQKLTVLALPNENAAGNHVHLSKTGQFKVNVPFNPTEQRGVGYNLETKVKTKNGNYQMEKQRGILEIYLDVVAPTLNVNQTVSGDQVTFTGTSNDNVCGVKVYLNGNNVFAQQNNAGFNVHDPDKPLNLYPDYQINQTENLKRGQNHFIFKAVDQAGNVVEKSFTINH